MTNTPVRGTCDRCGKVFRIPSADRTFACKACGGEVRATQETESAPPAAGRAQTTAKKSMTKVAAGKAAAPAEGEPATKPRRAAKRSSSPSWVLIALAVLLVAGGGWGGYTLLAKGAGRDIGAATAEFAQAWNEGDLDELASHYHPDARSEFRERLGKVAEHRKWQAGFPKVERQNALIVDGTPEDPKTGMSGLTYGESMATVKWQFEPTRERWYVYSLELPPTPLGEQAERFRSAWAQSKLEALHPFLRKDAREKWEASLTRKLATEGWTGAHPALGEPRIEGEERLHSRAVMLERPRVTSRFALADGRELAVHWGFHDPSDEWLLTSYELARKPE